MRNDVNVTLAGERCHATLNGLTLVSGEAACRVTIPPSTMPAELREPRVVQAILAVVPRSVFNGKIFVRPGARRRTRNSQSKPPSFDQATADTKPQLEIFADDVKCTHGATVGQSTDEEVFYLRSRGMSEEAARRM